MDSPFDLSGRVALVTGAGRGIGREVARTLASAGADVACVGSRLEAVAEAAADVTAPGRRAAPLVADVSDRPQVAEAVARALTPLGLRHTRGSSAGIARHAAAHTRTDRG